MDRTVNVFVCVIVSLFGSLATAEAAPAAKVMGWSKNANLGANISFSSSQDVVGQTDGSSQIYGLNLKGGLNRNSERDEWRNTLSILENTSKTPSVPRFIKSGDELKFNTIYLYSLESYPTIGPFISGELAAPMFNGEDVRSANTSYLEVHKDKTKRAFNGTTARLTDGFKPLTTKESVGAYWKPVQEENIKVEARLGFGAMQIQANGQYALGGNDDSGNVLLNELSSVSQAGLEAALGVKGKIDEKSTYEAGVEALTPFINNKAADDNRDAFRLTNVDGFLKYNSQITSWASLTYDYKLKIQPQLVDRAQQIHMIVLNLNYNLF
ncbi:MAG: hypothetical protein ACXVA9_07990 [Bdellovibrionales bacterium]